MSKSSHRFVEPPKPHRSAICCWPGCHSPLMSEFPLCTTHIRVAYDYQIGRIGPVGPTFRFYDEVPATEPQRDKPSKDGTVYYVQVGAHIKIGWASDLTKRMRAYPPNSQLLAAEPGTRQDEARMHRRFAAHRTHGREWYAPVPSILHHIEQVKAKHQQPEDVVFGAQPVTIPEPRGPQYSAQPRGLGPRHVAG